MESAFIKLKTQKLILQCSCTHISELHVCNCICCYRVMALFPRNCYTVWCHNKFCSNCQRNLPLISIAYLTCFWMTSVNPSNISTSCSRVGLWRLGAVEAAKPGTWVPWTQVVSANRRVALEQRNWPLVESSGRELNISTQHYSNQHQKWKIKPEPAHFCKILMDEHQLIQSELTNPQVWVIHEGAIVKS